MWRRQKKLRAVRATTDRRRIEARMYFQMRVHLVCLEEIVRVWTGNSIESMEESRGKDVYTAGITEVLESVQREKRNDVSPAAE